MDTITFDEANITSKQNGNNPEWNEPCHTLAVGNANRATVCIKQNLGGDAWSGLAEQEITPTPNQQSTSHQRLLRMMRGGGNG